MRAALISAPGALEVTTVPDPSPAAGEVVVEIAAVGICGTDLHI
ncbi:MAG: alcohol dehydrogenase, partial [Actinobacteria bacterium]|nr:alcohol dehydrogenase [Actinomycetota bacterium]